MNPGRQRDRSIEVGFDFELQLPSLTSEERQDLARAVDRLAPPGNPPGVELVGGTRRLYRMRVGAWRVLFTRTPETVRLLTLVRGYGGGDQA